jgi:predicted DCC family thiol-disulfide oxidoreductase YuxK
MPHWILKVLYDGSCPLCTSEMRWLQRLDKENRLAFEDIAAPEFAPHSYGKTGEQLMGAIHGELPDGRLIEGVEVFRRAYSAVGMGWLLAPTGWPVLRPLFDRLYSAFARNRTSISNLLGRSCAEGGCRIHN